jgi:predicted transcriptional regulator
MLTLEQIRQALQDRRPGMVAEATGLHINTILSVRDDDKADPKYSTMKALSDYLEGCNDNQV